MARRFLITGGSSGIGAATAIQISRSEKEAKFALVGRNLERLQQVAQDCIKEGQNVEAFTIVKDFSARNSGVEVINEAVSKLGGKSTQP